MAGANRVVTSEAVVGMYVFDRMTTVFARHVVLVPNVNTPGFSGEVAAVMERRAVLMPTSKPDVATFVDVRFV